MDTRQNLHALRARRLIALSALGLLASISVSAVAAAATREYFPARVSVGAPYMFRGGFAYRFYGPPLGYYGAPLGLYVSVLPPFYSTVWWSGIPYYYADDVYYTWRPDRGEYEVVAPPNAADTSAPTTASGNDLFIYPKNGQSEGQQAKDRYECHGWASGQSGFDPTQTSGGVPTGEAASKRSDYLRAMTVCLEARNYAVR